nr:PREDICTED: uncharacterized protein LOC109038304 [Bemisia tabaci]
MMVKATLLAVLATVLIAESSAKALGGPKESDYSGINLPGFNYTHDVVGSVINVTAPSVWVGNLYWPQFGEATHVTDDDWWNMTFPHTYPVALTVVPNAEFQYVEDGVNKTEDGMVIADASKIQYTLHVTVKMDNSGEYPTIDSFESKIVVDSVELSIVKKDKDYEDRLEANPEAFAEYQEALEQQLREYLAPALNEQIHSDETESAAGAKLTPTALRRHLKRGPLKHVKLPKALRL